MISSNKDDVKNHGKTVGTRKNPAGMFPVRLALMNLKNPAIVAGETITFDRI